MRAALCVVLLLAVNVATAWRLFSTEFTAHMNSNEGSFMAISRFLIENWPHVSWFPYWFNGLPFENTYSPLLQVVDALIAVAFQCSTALAFHFTAAAFYSIGPVMLFVFARQASGRLWPSLTAGLLYSLTSPSVLYPQIRLDLGSWFYARRLHTIVHYGEVPHNIVLALLPLALLFGWYAISRRQYRWYAALWALSGLMLLTNAFAAVMLAVSLTSLVVVQPRSEWLRSFATLAIAGALAYALVCPLLPPSLISIIHTNSQLVDGDYRYNARTYLFLGIFFAGAVGLWFVTRRLGDPVERFSWLFLYIFATITALGYIEAHLVPQSRRYHLEMEMGFCLAAAFTIFGRLRSGPVRAVAAALLVCFLIRQGIVYRHYARELIKRIDITSTIEYQTAKWIDANLPGQRTLVLGSTGLWFNVFTNNPQLGSGHRPFLPNRTIEHALYAMGTSPDPNTTILWLKAFGCQAIAFSGPNGRDSYKTMWSPEKFKGVLPLIRQDGDDLVYAVPQYSTSLAHVVPAGAIVSKPPIHGLDLDGVARFVAALQTAGLQWERPDRGRIIASMNRDDVIALQVTYDPGWVARVHGRPVPITRDGIGLMTIHPDCDGQCEINLSFGAGIERTLCRVASMLSILIMIGINRKLLRIPGNWIR